MRPAKAHASSSLCCAVMRSAGLVDRTLCSNSLLAQRTLFLVISGMMKCAGVVYFGRLQCHPGNEKISETDEFPRQDFIETGERNLETACALWSFSY
jgi:hypothetical protein